MKKLNFLVFAAVAVILTFSSFKSALSHNEKSTKQVAIDGVYVGTLDWYPNPDEPELLQRVQVFVNVNDATRVSGLKLVSYDGSYIGPYKGATGNYNGSAVANVNCPGLYIVDAYGTVY